MKSNEVVDNLQEAATWITETADHDFDENHQKMCDAIDEASSLIHRLERVKAQAYKKNSRILMSIFDLLKILDDVETIFGRVLETLLQEERIK